MRAPLRLPLEADRCGPHTLLVLCVLATSKLMYHVSGKVAQGYVCWWHRSELHIDSSVHHRCYQGILRRLIGKQRLARSSLTCPLLGAQVFQSIAKDVMERLQDTAQVGGLRLFCFSTLQKP